MSFATKVPEYIAQLEKEAQDLRRDRFKINWGHDCDCEYCDREGDDADPEAEQKVEDIDASIKAKEMMVDRLKSYAELMKINLLIEGKK